MRSLTGGSLGGGDGCEYESTRFSKNSVASGDVLGLGDVFAGAASSALALRTVSARVGRPAGRPVGMAVLLRATTVGVGGLLPRGDPSASVVAPVIRSRALAGTLIVVFARARVPTGVTSMSGPFKRFNVPDRARPPSSLASLESRKTFRGLTPSRKRVTPVNVVYASLGFSVATSLAFPRKSRVLAFLSLFSDGR
jgi:hypothetical protein